MKKEDFDFKKSCLDCLDVFKNIFTKPVEAIKEFVDDNKFLSGIIMVVATALSTGIYKIASLKRVFDDASSGWFKPEQPEYLKEFFTTFGANLLEYALIAILGYVIISKFLKGKITIKQSIIAVGISLSLVIIANLVNSILVFIDSEAVSYIMGYIFTFAKIYCYLILYKAISEVGKIDKNRVFLSVASMTVLATVTIDILDKLFNK